MMICAAKIPRRRVLAPVLLAVLLAALAAVFLLRGREGAGALPALRDNGERVAYLRELGWEVEEEPLESFRFLLPEALEEPYLSYNALQLPQGFDLGEHCGEEIDRYTYAVTNYPNRPSGVQANLYLSAGTPVAGDILCPGADGFQEPLIRSGN